MRSRALTLTLSTLVLAPGLALSQSGAPLASASAGSPTRAMPEVATSVVDGTDGAVGEKHVPFVATPASSARLTTGVPGVAGVAAGKHVVASTAAVSVSPDLVVVGASWAKGSAPGAVLEYRLRSAGRWGAWQVSDSDPAIDESRAGGRDGSDAIPVTGATHVQARLVGSAVTPKDARLAILSPASSRRDAAAVAAVASARVGAAGLSGAAISGGASLVAAPDAAVLPVRTRVVWKANERISGRAPQMSAPAGFTVHHTAGSNTYTQAQVPRILRGIQQFHVRDRGWSDIGYNYLVDKWGGIWEGRQGSHGGTPRGAHTAGFNDSLIGISLIGDYQKARPSAAAVQRITRIIAWKSAQIGLDPAGTTRLGGRTRPVVVGHRDVNSTACPGQYLYAKLPEIRREAAAIAAG